MQPRLSKLPSPNWEDSQTSHSRDSKYSLHVRQRQPLTSVKIFRNPRTHVFTMTDLYSSVPFMESQE